MLGRMLACVAFFVRFIVSVFAKAEQAFGAPRRLCFERCEDRNLLAGGSSSGWAGNVDYNFDGECTPVDALVCINDINQYGVHRKNSMVSNIRPVEAVDPNFDGWATPADVLVVVNWLNWHGAGPLYDCKDYVYMQYVDSDPVYVTPGDTHVLVAQAILTASFTNANPVFLSQATAVGDSDFMRLEDEAGKWVGMSWQDWRQMNLNNIELDPGVPVRLDLYADIKDDALPGVLNFGLDDLKFMDFPGGSVEWLPVNDNREVIVQQPSFTVELDPSTPFSQVVAGNQSVTAAKFKLTAAASSYTVEEVKFTVPAESSAVILSASLLDGTTVLATAPFMFGMESPNDTVFFTGLDFMVSANTSKVLTVQYALFAPSSDYGTSGLNVKSTLHSIKVADNFGVEAKQFPNVSGNDLYVYKSVPTFTALALPVGQGTNLSSGATTSLFSFRIGADAKGSIAMKQLKLRVVVTDAGTAGDLWLSSFKLFRGSTDITSQATIQLPIGISLESGTSLGIGEFTVVITFDTEEQISAGASYDYTLKAVGHGFAVSAGGSDSVSVQLLGEDPHSQMKASYLDAISNTSVQALYGAAGHNQGTGTLANIIWSDNSSLAHNYVFSDSSNDWFDGNLMRNLPLDAVVTTAI